MIPGGVLAWIGEALLLGSKGCWFSNVVSAQLAHGIFGISVRNTDHEEHSTVYLVRSKEKKIRKYYQSLESGFLTEHAKHCSISVQGKIKNFCLPFEILPLPCTL